MPNPTASARARTYSDPALGAAFENVASLFAPPSAQDIYAYTKAGAERDKAQRLSDLYRQSQSPDFNQQTFDRGNIATGNYAPNASYYGVDTKATTDRRGQDIESGDRRYNTDVTASTSRTNNTADNDRALKVAIMAPTPEGAIVTRPPDVADTYKVPEQTTGIVKLKPGEKATVPGGGVLQGNAEQPGQHPFQVFNYTTPDGKKGFARVDQGTGVAVDTQTGQQLPQGVTMQGTSGGTTVNVGDNGAPYGNPPPGMAWKRSPDGKVAIGESGAPVAIPIEGGPAAQKEADRAKAAGQDAARQSVALQDVDRALDLVQNRPGVTTGLIGNIMKGAGGSAAANLDALLGSLKSYVSLDRLQAMRQASPTGGALGNVSDKDVQLLADAYGSLSQVQGAKQLADNLKRYKNIMLDIVHGPGNGPQREQLSFNRTQSGPGTSGGPSASGAQTDASSLPSAIAGQLREGVSTTFGNGQVWTLRNGTPMRVQ